MARLRAPSSEGLVVKQNLRVNLCYWTCGRVVIALPTGSTRVSVNGLKMAISPSVPNTLKIGRFGVSENLVAVYVL